VRAVVLPVAIFLGLLIFALLLPSKQDTSVAAWWRRVRQTVNVAFRVGLVLLVAGVIVWFVVVPILRWNALGR
jgi:hypothetical protein